MASGAVLGILNRGGLYDWIWDYIDIDSITLLNWETGDVEYIGSDTSRFVVKFPFDAEIPTISGTVSTNPQYIYISDSGNRTVYGTSIATTFATSYDESKRELTIDVTNRDWAENYSDSRHHYLFHSITFNRK